MSDTAKTNSGAEVQTGLSRDLGLPSALAIGVGTMIAAGIFTLSGLAVSYVGSAAIASFLLAAVVACFTALTYCEFTSLYPESGEGYLYARRTFSPPLAYLVGWCLLLGYTASCGFYIASLSSYFNEFIWHAPVEMLSGLVVVVALTLLNIRGTRESGNFQIVVTVAKVALLIWFVAGGLGHVDLQEVRDKFSTDIMEIGGVAALVFVTFFGFSAIAASAGEIKNPGKTIPRAIFISVGFVTVLYCLVVLVVLAANLTHYDEAAMGKAAEGFLGAIGGKVIVAGAIFSMIAAANASILAGSRVALAMSQRGHLPREIGSINENTRTPVVALILVGGGIGAFAVLMPLEGLAHFADAVLLLALILVNAALIAHRRRYPHLKRPFRVPLVPLLPGLGIVFSFYLLSQGDVTSMIAAGAAVVVGVLGFFAWKGSRSIEAESLPGERSQVALEAGASPERVHRTLVPLANPATAKQLVGLAAATAKHRNGRIVAMRAVVVPEQLPVSAQSVPMEQEQDILDLARDAARGHEVPATALVRVGHNAARAILDASLDKRCDLIVLGWKGYASKAQHILGEVTDSVVTHASTDIMLVKLVPEAPPLKNLLLPSAGGEHAVRAEEYAADIAAENGGSITMMTVVAEDAPEELLESEQERLRLAQERVARLHDIEVRITIARDRSVSQAIIAEGEKHDGIVIGAAGQSFSNQVLFGSIPEDVARRSTKPVVVIKRHRKVKALLGRVMGE